MAGKRSAIPFEKVSLNLGRGDFARMGELFPALGSGVAIRTLVRNYIRSVEASAAPIEIDLNPQTVTELLDDDRATAGSGNSGPNGPSADPGAV